MPPFSQILEADSRLSQGQQPTTFFCGDDAEAKQVLAKLLEELDLEAVDAGLLTAARWVEASGF
ncbi:MAG: hypothetical protein QNJ04_09930 [Desulfobacterales bacterium]|nr:hypothetical protein [Desulfobacterales bacterium]